MQYKLFVNYLIIINLKLLLKTANKKNQNKINLHKQHIDYLFYKSTKTISIVQNKQYLQFFNVVLPFFSQLIKQNYTVFFNNFSSYTKKNNLFVKKTQKRAVITHKTIFVKYSHLRHFYKSSVNF
jgi:hypothetical protein